MIVLFTDFGPAGPYVGQMRAAIAAHAPEARVIELLADAPAFDPQSSAYLLAALAADFPPDAVFLAVIDPGVGGERPPVIIRADRQRFIGPGNGLFEIIARRASNVSARRIAWTPDRLSASFHGRDLFAPVAAMVESELPVETAPIDDDAHRRPDWPDDLDRIVYIDTYGNAMTGRRASTLSDDTILEAADRQIARARTFSDVAPGAAFWYENANGLAEIAVNRGRASAIGLEVGSPITICES
jgi:S-adenosylmethionine hydrolase